MHRSGTVHFSLCIFLLVAVCSGCSAVKARDESVAPEVQQSQPADILKPSVDTMVKQKQTRLARTKLKATQSNKAAVTTRPTMTQPVRGIYVSGWVAGDKKQMAKLVRLVDRTDLNTMVIDVKNDYGNVTYRSQVDEVKAIGADVNPAIPNIKGLLAQLKAKNIYTIGRVVAFKDPYYAKKRPTMALQKKTGGVWKDKQGNLWLDPYQAKVRSYNIAIAREAAELGFDEIQFDYVRFPDNGAKVNRQVRFAPTGGKNKPAIIGTFLQEARLQVHQAGAKLSADVFGLVTSSKDDMGIGQTWRSIASTVDVISPMTYPSHYSSGTYGIHNPDLSPAAIIRQAMADAKKGNATLTTIGLQPAQIRPWLQSFTATWIEPHQHYGANQIQSQINAARKQGVTQFLLWNSECKYDYRS
ncbi:hypothetical protein FHS18_005887 [Paenibacillus phyllosphaerae]|uniref:DUF4015 domain-containing protein n=1 Tax=Paenibacillus phyllosphaerae TaxID=274593 RepID=A0A7W5FR79_9BACL|nr:putative glycoside hydrolase [Paenibacillus phyllosphaerae]MBB3113774.1 hypothetical protein [Paenibacillus phyllosphaerae]